MIKERASLQEEIKIEKDNYKKDCGDYIEQIQMFVIEFYFKGICNFH